MSGLTHIWLFSRHTRTHIVSAESISDTLLDCPCIRARLSGFFVEHEHPFVLLQQVPAFIP